MLSVLVEGTLIAAPVRRTSAKGSAFVTAQVRCHADDGESVFCSVIAFQAQTAEALAGLAAGDAVAVAGPASLSQWEKNGEHRVGLKVTATRVLSVYDAGARRRAATAAAAAAGAAGGEREPRGGPAPAPHAAPDAQRPPSRAGGAASPRRLVDWDDDIPV